MNKNVKVTADNNFTPLPDNSPAKVISLLEIHMLKYQPNMKGWQAIKRVSKNIYVCTDTDEIKEYSKTSNRASNLYLRESLKKSGNTSMQTFMTAGNF